MRYSSIRLERRHEILHGPRRVEPPAPLDRVRQQLAERLRDRFAHVVRQLRVELHHEILHAFGDFERAGRHELQPLRARRDHLDRQRRRGGRPQRRR